MLSIPCINCLCSDRNGNAQIREATSSSTHAIRPSCLGGGLDVVETEMAQAGSIGH